MAEDHLSGYDRKDQVIVETRWPGQIEKKEGESPGQEGGDNGEGDSIGRLKSRGGTRRGFKT